MLSVIIATRDSERALVPTLSALVPGATAGLVREVILADADSRDATAEVADVAGCRLLVSSAPPAARMAQAAEEARAPWLLFLVAGAVPQAGWIEETARFIEEATQAGQADRVAAVFPAVGPSIVAASQLRGAVIQVAAALGLMRRASPGLLICRDLYLRTTGRNTAAQDSELDGIGGIVRRLGRRRIATLRCGLVGG